MSMEDILKVLVDSRQQGGASNSSGNQDPMGALVGSLLGGGQPQAGGNQSAGGLGNMMGLLESVMGGAGTTGANDPLMGILQPFVAPLAKKANISPEIATIVVSFVVHKLLAHHPDSGRDSTSFNFEDMFQQMGSGKLDQNMLQSSGMVKELAARTGLDEDTAAKSLELAFTLVGKGATSLMNRSKSSAGKSAPAGSKSGAGSASKFAGRTIKR